MAFGAGSQPPRRRFLAAVAKRFVTETHHLDVKREVGGTDGERANIARHLASLAIDGGSLLIGLEEDKPKRTWLPRPQPPDGLAERVEQIAVHLIDPPLYVTSAEIPSSGNGGQGYLLVYVPPSSQAPHMVAGVYYGRGDRTRVRLSDAEVLRYHARRESLDALTERLLDEEAARDPQPRVDLRKCGRLYAVAQPLTAPRHLALAITSGAQADLRSMINRVEASIPRTLAVDPSPHLFNYQSRRAQGVAFSEHVLTGPGRTLWPHKDGADPDEERMLDLEIRQDGGLRLLVGRLTAVWGTRARDDPTLDYVVLDAVAVAYSLRLVRWAAELSSLTGYRGSWALGIHGTGMRGLMSGPRWSPTGSSAGSCGHSAPRTTGRRSSVTVTIRPADRGRRRGVPAARAHLPRHRPLGGARGTAGGGAARQPAPCGRRADQSVQHLARRRGLGRVRSRPPARPQGAHRRRAGNPTWPPPSRCSVLPSRTARRRSGC